MRKRSEPPVRLLGVIMLFCLLFVCVWFYAILRTASGAASTDGWQSDAAPADADTARNLLVEGAEETFYTLPPELRPALEEPPADDKALPYDTLYNVLSRWNPDNPDPPKSFREKIQHFDYGNPYERQLADRWRKAELPFKLYNVSEFQATSRKWTEEYLLDSISSGRQPHVEKSKNNHFMFWSGKGSRIRNYKPPTEIVSGMSFKEWNQLAKEADRMRLSNSSEHYYFMVGADAHEHGRTFISRDLPMFSTEKNNYWITNVAANKGIQCRFSMRGIIAETHYDSGKNFIAMLKGAKRYVLTPPHSCDHLAIITDTKHPSYRHSVIDWSDLAQCRQNKFHEVDALDTIVHKGEVLYIPSYWFHYIVSLKYSVQCNSRSGAPPSRVGWDSITSCLKHAVN